MKKHQAIFNSVLSRNADIQSDRLCLVTTENLKDNEFMNPFINMTAQKVPDPFIRSDFSPEKIPEDSGFLKMLQKEIRKDEPAKQTESVREPEFRAEKKTSSGEKPSEYSAMQEKQDDRSRSVSSSPAMNAAQEKTKPQGKQTAALQKKADASPAVRGKAPVLKTASAQPAEKLSSPAAAHVQAAVIKSEKDPGKPAVKEKQTWNAQAPSEKKKPETAGEKAALSLQEKTAPEQMQAAAKIPPTTDAGTNTGLNRLMTKEEIPAVNLRPQIPAKNQGRQISADRKNTPEQKIQTVPEKKNDLLRTAEQVQEQKKKISVKGKTDPVHTETAGIKPAPDKQDMDSTFSRTAVSADSVTIQDSGSDKGGAAFRFAGNGTGDFKPGASLQEAANLMKEQPGRFQEQLQTLMNGAKLQVKDSRNASLNLNLYPRALGTITLNLGLEQGILSGRFIVDSPEARELLNENMNYIKQQLQESGIQLGQFQVDVRDRGNHQHERDSRTDYQFAAVKNEITEDPVSAAYEMNFTGSHDGSVNLII